MKKVSSVMLVIIMIVSAFFTTGVYAADEIKVSINDKLQTYDQMPVIVEGRTLVPMRAIFESLGATVEWADATKMVTGTKGDTVVKIQIGKNIAIVNGKAQTLDVAAQIVSGRTMVPARFVAESLGCEVGWDADSKTVLIKFDGALLEKEETKNEEVSVETGSAEGTVVLSNINMKDMNVTQKAGTVKFQEGLIEAEVTSEPASQTDVYASFKKTLNNRAKTGDVCLITFKARLLSGGKDGKGIAKVQVQGDSTNNYKKTVFEEVTFGSDWTDISLPFAYEEGCNTIGIRFALAIQKVEIKDVNLVNYGTNKTIEELGAGGTTPLAPSQSTGDVNGTSVLAPLNMKDMNVSQKAGTIEFQEGLITADVTSETTTQTDVYASFKKTLNGRALSGDVCLLTFKARLLSGGKDGKGIAKVQVQGDSTNNYKKTVFEEVTFGSDWTDISLPFIYQEGCNTIGIRFALALQKVEIKDVNLVNYGKAKTVEELTKKVN